MTTIKKALWRTGLVTFAASIALLAAQNALGQRWMSIYAIPVYAFILSALITAIIYSLVLNPMRRTFTDKLMQESQTGSDGAIMTNDPLTGLLNKRGITVQLLESMAHTQRYGSPLTVALVDVDHFKKLNDNHGKETSDKLLTELAPVLMDTLRMPDRIGNYDTGQFLVILPETKRDAAHKIADRLRHIVGSAKFKLDNGETESVTLSIGVTQYEKGEDLNQLLSRAETAIHEARNQGHNTVISV